MRTPARFLRAFLLACLALIAAAPGRAGAVPGPGDLPPPALGRNLAGDDIALPAFAGKVVVLTFWATWCPYCLQELPVLDGVQRVAGQEQLRVIAVNTENRDVFRRTARALRPAMAMELVSDASGLAQQAYGVKSLPHMVIVGRDGRIVRLYHGYSKDSLDGIVADINRALAAGAEPAPAP
jgi:thiol-disulfide isomerase/thioredoxin